MKICLFTTSFFPYLWTSGISNVVHLITRNLIEKHDAEISVYCQRDQGQKSKETSKSITIYRYDPFNLGNFGFSTKPLRIQKDRNFDLIHSFHYGYFPATAGLITSKRNHIPHFFTTAYHPPIYTNWRKSLLWLYNVTQGSHILKHSRVVFPFNKNEQTQLEKYSKANYKIIPSPIDSKVFKPKRVEKDKFTITYAGTLLPWKGSLIAMKIFKEIEKERKDVNFTIIGRGPLENQLKKNAGKHFTFLKELTAEQLSTQYNTSDILVSPTYYESFGCVLAEAGMCGTPVVSTNVGAVPETVGKGGLLVNYGQWEKMKKLILMLLDDDKLRKKLGKDSIKHTQQYRDDVVSNKIYKNYKSVLNTGEKI